MSKEIAVVQNLIGALDDSRLQYGERAVRTAHPDLKELLERIARTHRVIADDLAGRLIAAGGKARRHGSRMGPLRARLAEGLARIGFHVETAYASQMEKREAGILHGFRNAVTRVRDIGLRNRLQLHRHEIERASMEIGCLRLAMRVNLRTVRAAAHVSPHAPAHSNPVQINR